MKTNNRINYKTVNKPEDFLLFSLRNKNGKINGASDYYTLSKDRTRLILRADINNLYPEIYVELTLKIHNPSCLMKEEVVLAEGKSQTCDGWKLYIDRYGYLVFNGTGKSSALKATSRLSLTSFVGHEFKVAVALNNNAFLRRTSKYWQEAVAYNKLLLMASTDIHSRMEILNAIGKFRNKTLSPVPESIELPVIKAKNKNVEAVHVRACNTARYELFQDTPQRRSGCKVDSKYSGASKVFVRYHSNESLVDIYTGPEFCMTTSYWIFTKVKNAIQDTTRFRIHLSIGDGTPNMAPVLFWSVDRRKWFRIKTLEATKADAEFYPLFTAPAKNFYLSSSMPFMGTELHNVMESVKHMAFVKVFNVGQTVEGRAIALFKITDPNTSDSEKKHAAIIAGQHSPQEMLGGHFLMPMTGYFKKHPELLKKIVLYFIPIVNRDCAHWGGNGLNANKQNTNRCWFKNLQPETSSIRNYFRKLKAQGVEIDFFLDIHAGGTWRNHTVLRYPDRFFTATFPHTSKRLIQNKHRALTLLEEYAGFRVVDGKDSNFRHCCAEDYFRITYPDAVTFTLELSTSSYYDPILRESRVVDQKSLPVIGEGLVKSIVAYFGWAI